jgi:alkanesulfonate monooxygenase SsuD/methylene tetrahydromethanopterin reductase-like flavin-dependent oxidoreductase (luciferase family)
VSARFGIFAPQGWRLDLTEIADPVEQYEAMTAVARAADRGPWDSVWVFDHLHTVPEVTRESTFEGWITTAGLLRDTEHVHVGQMVTCNGYRQPSLLAKMASTAHVAGHGRLYTGLGAGWYEHEWRAYGYPWPTTRDRMAAFAEAVELVHRLWTENDVVFTGKHYQVDRPVNEPKGVGGSHPPLWIGGAGEQVTLGLVARYADGCNFGRQAGRDPPQSSRSCADTATGSAPTTTRSPSRQPSVLSRSRPARTPRPPPPRPAADCHWTSSAPWRSQAVRRTPCA